VPSSTDQPNPLSPRRIACVTEVPHRSRLRPYGLPTRTGMGLAAMLLLLGFVAANPGLNLLLLLFGLGVGAIIFNALVARWQVNLAQVRRILPDVAAVGRPTTVRYHVHNRSRWMALRSLWIVDNYNPSPPGLPVLATWVLHVPPGGSAVAEARVVPTRRGLCRIDALRLASKFPFGLFKRLQTLQLPDHVLVWPALWQPRANWLARSRWTSQPRNIRNGAVQRGTDEFFGIREYRPGDNVRWIHWRRSASLDRVVIREMVDADPGRVTLALETVGPTGPADPDTLDALVSAAASLACDALERGWHVGVILNGHTPVVLPPAGGYATRSRLLYELAILDAAPTRRLAGVLSQWPAGPQWTGRAVLLHPGPRQGDPSIEAAATQLSATVGSVLHLATDDLADWFDRSGSPASAADYPTQSAKPPPLALPGDMAATSQPGGPPP
jgi:uncharacterized protein (DUF58 family)